MKEPKWILPEVARAIHEELIQAHGGLPGVRDPNQLESALNRPRQFFLYKEERDLCRLAALQAEAIARGHPFVDGNKRMALVLMILFLELNGLKFNAPEAECVWSMQALAAGQWSADELYEWLEQSII